MQLSSLRRAVVVLAALASTILAMLAASPSGSATSGTQVTGPTLYPALPAPTYSTVSEDIAVPMSDGVQIGVTVTYPSKDGSTRAPGRFPVVLSMTPYGRKGMCGCPSASLFATRGIVSAVADTRGTGGSGGNLDQNYFSPREAKDGAALVQYFGTRAWSNGRVGMAGGSYVGITQYLTAEQQPSHLAAIVPQVALADLYRDAFTHGGIPNIFFDGQYIAVQGGPGLVTPGGTNQVPMTVQSKLQQLMGTPIALDYLKRPDDDAFYRARSPYYQADRIKVPVLIIDGWRDGFVRGAIEMYQRLRQRVGVETRLYVDPCTHKGCGAPFAATIKGPGKDGEQAMQFAFLSHYLRGTREGPTPAVRTYLQPDTGRTLQTTQWPPAGTRFERLALGAGTIAPQARPGTQSYVTNPLAGLSSPLDEYGTIAISPYVPTDQRPEGANGITWRTGVLSRPLTLAGPIGLHLVAATSGTDTDWVAKLSDVAPDGSEQVISDGYLRASHRQLDPARSTTASPYHTHTNPTPVTPGRFYAYDIGIWPTAYRLAPGHRLQLRLTTYDVPTHAPAGVALGSASVQPITPTVNTVRDQVSTLLLPVLGD